MPGRYIDQRRSDRIIEELARKLGKSPGDDSTTSGARSRTRPRSLFPGDVQRDVVAGQYGDLPKDVLLRGIVLHDHHEGKRRAFTTAGRARN